MTREHLLKILMPHDSSPNTNPNPDYKNIFINAAVMGGISFFSCLVSLVPLPNAAAAAGLAFCTSAGIQLGLIKKK